MAIGFRIKVEDKKLFPMIAFFNSVGDNSFIDIVDSLTRGVGASYNSVHCHFPGDMDEYELVVERGGKVPEGIEFSFDWGEEVVVDTPTFRHYLTLACEAYMRDHPEDRARIEELLARPQPPLTTPHMNLTT